MSTLNRDRPLLAGLIVTALVTALAIVTMSAAAGPALDRVETADDLASLAMSVDPGDPERATLLALAGYRLHASNDTQAALRTISDRYRYVQRVMSPGGGTTSAIADDPHTGRLYSAGDDGQLRVWDSGSGEQNTAIAFGATRITNLAYQPDVRLLLGGDTDGGVYLWQCDEQGVPEGMITLAPPDDTSRSSAVAGVHFYANGTHVVAVVRSGQLRAWRLDDDHSYLEVVDLGATSLAESDLAMGKDQQIIGTSLVEYADRAAMLVATDNAVAFVDLPTGEQLPADEPPDVELVMPPGTVPGKVAAIAAHPEAGWAVGTDIGVFTGDRDTGATHRIADVADTLAAMQYDTDGVTLQVAGSEGITVYSIGESDSEAARAVSRPLDAYVVAMTPAVDGVLAAVTGAGAIVTLAVMRSRLAMTPAAASTSLVFTEDGAAVLTEVDASNRTTSLYTVSPALATEEPADQTRPTRRREYHPDSEWWSATDTFFVNDAAVSDRYVVVAGQDPDRHGVVLAWDAATGRPLTRLPFPGGNPDLARSVLISPALGLVIASNTAGELAAWSTDTWTERFRLNLGPTAQPVIFGPRHNLVALLLSEGTGTAPADIQARRLTLIDLEKPENSQRILPVVGVRILASRPDGGQLAALTDDNNLTFIDGDGKVEPTRIPVGGFATSVAYRPDGRQLAVTRADGHIVIIDVAARRPAYPDFVDTSGSIPSKVAWDPSGRFIATAVGTPQAQFLRAVRVDFWPADPNIWADVLCAILGPRPEPANDPQPTMPPRSTLCTDRS